MNHFFLRTERLILRPFSYEDVQFMVELNSDPEVVRYTGNTAFNTENEAKEVVTSLMRQFEEKKMGRFVVTELKSGERLGWCGLKWHESEQIVDLGYRFFRRYWGKGFASEASRACLAYGFGDLCLPKIAAHAMLENVASVHVLEKLGFKRTGPASTEGMNAEGFVLFRQDYQS